MEENQSAPPSSTLATEGEQRKGIRFDSIAHALKIPLKKARSIAIRRHLGRASCLPGKESLCPETSGSPFCSSLGGENEEQEEGSSAAAG
jgi:hypothetical protein